MIQYVVVIALVLIGAVATMVVGMSQENKKSNPNYDRRTKSNWVRLSIFYTLALAAFVAIWIIYD